MPQFRSDSPPVRNPIAPHCGSKRWRRALACFALLAILAPTPALAERDGLLQTPVVRKTWDVVALRPFDLIQLGVSAGFFVLAWPVTWVTGGGDFVREVCITLPVDRTFRRPLGEF